MIAPMTPERATRRRTPAAFARQCSLPIAAIHADVQVVHLRLDDNGDLCYCNLLHDPLKAGGQVAGGVVAEAALRDCGTDPE